MNKICEMIVTDYFKLSSGHIAFIGIFDPDLDFSLNECKAQLYINNKKIKVIDVLGEDVFSGVKKEVQQKRRAIRTSDNIYDELKLANDKSLKLIFYYE